MHRLRKRSDPRRSQVPDSLPAPPSQSRDISRSPSTSQEPLPALPPPSDFRTSLILPDLTRRFTLLRSSTGDPLAIDDLRSRFAEQRARRTENALSEEESDMLLATLGRLRAKTSTSSSELSMSASGDSGYNVSSARSSDTIASAPSSRVSSKRYSNNMFGSGRFRDISYLRSVQQQQRNGSGRSALSTASASNNHFREDDDGIEVVLAERALSRALPRDQLHRASMALDEVIREIEEEVEAGGNGDEDDKVLVPRSPADSRGVARVPTTAGSGAVFWEFETGTAFSPDHPVQDFTDNRQSPSPYPRSGDTSPTPRLPGYIPGMPRPMTPRDFASESDNASTVTPRATSPRFSASNRGSPAPSTLPRRDSARNSNSRVSNDQFISRLLNGRRTPDVPSGRSSPEKQPRYTHDEARYSPDPSPGGVGAQHTRTGSLPSADDSFMDFGTPPDSYTLSARLRPASQSSGVYQSMSLPGPSSRPTTPSNVTWKVPTASPTSSSVSHNRNGSIISSNEMLERTTLSLQGRLRSGSVPSSKHDRNGSMTESAEGFTFGRTISPMSGSRSLRSPPLPDSPFVDGGNSFSAFPAENRPPSVTSGLELGSPLVSPAKAHRAPASAGHAPTSPASPVFSDADHSYSRANTRPGQYHTQQGAPSPFSLHQPHALLFSPIANSSHSSLESVGSSYHSREADNKQDRVLPLLAALESPQSTWHDLSALDKSPSSASGSESLEDTLQHFAGLSRADFARVQERLVVASNARSGANHARERTNSLRKRRPSNSQTAPVLAIQDAAPPSPSAQVQKALLDSVVDSIVSRPENLTQASGADDMPLSPTLSEASSTTRRRRAALADALFGSGELDDTREAPPRSNLPSQHSENDVTSPQSAISSFDAALVHHPVKSLYAPAHPTSTARTVEVQAQSPGSHASSALAPTLTLPDHSELTLEVQRRTEAAMALLRKNPSSTHLPERGSPVPKRRIDPSQISSPRLDWASTSVDAIPLPQTPSSSPSAVAPQAVNSKLGSRFAKKLRGTLRTKPASSGEEVSPFTLMTPTSAQSVVHDTAYLSPSTSPQAARTVEGNRWKPAVATPPVSSGPGLKGFMSRFRKNRAQEGPDSERDRSSNTASHSQSSSILSGASEHSRPPTGLEEVRSAPAANTTFRSIHSKDPSSTSSASDITEPPPSAPAGGLFQAAGYGSSAQAVEGADRTLNDETALKQLFDAASNLGLDQAALNDLLARSPSLSTKRSTTTPVPKHASATPSLTPSWVDPSRIASPHTASIRVASPVSTSGRPSLEQTAKMSTKSVIQQPSESVPRLTLRKQTVRKSTATERNAIVRRTIIMPSDLRQSIAPPSSSPQPPLRKSSTRRRRSASASSTYSNSVHDRAPTPPPPKSPLSSRFLFETSPPVPQVPMSLAQPHSVHTYLTAPGPFPMEKSSSTYDSLYDMYTSDNRPTIITPEYTDVGEQSTSLDMMDSLEPGSAVEVLEMANGETVWNIVQGLREDALDTDSFYGNRASFLSEYSLGGDEGVQVFFKEHGRKSSKDSTNSFLSRRKTQQLQPKRPETKVFYSSPAQIGRLIDNLSQGLGVDSGSFNIVPGLPTTFRSNSPPAAPHSYHSESSTNWTVEERIERMLASTTEGAGMRPPT